MMSRAINRRPSLVALSDARRPPALHGDDTSPVARSSSLDRVHHRLKDGRLPRPPRPAAHRATGAAPVEWILLRFRRDEVGQVRVHHERAAGPVRHRQGADRRRRAVFLITPSPKSRIAPDHSASPAGSGPSRRATGNHGQSGRHGRPGRLPAPAPPPAKLTDLLLREKTDLVELFGLVGGRSAEDWRVFVEERAATAEFDGGLTRLEAQARAFSCGVVEWLNRRPIRSPAGRCMPAGLCTARAATLSFRIGESDLALSGCMPGVGRGGRPNGESKPPRPWPDLSARFKPGRRVWATVMLGEPRRSSRHRRAPVRPATSISISRSAAKLIISRNRSASGVFSISVFRFIVSSSDVSG